MSSSLLRSVIGSAAMLALLPAAARAEAPKVERMNAYLIYEDSGERSKNVADQADQIIANGEKGQSVQMIVEIVMGGKAEQLYENAPVLHVVVHGSDPGTPPIVNAEFPISFMAGNKLFRTVIVDHNCNGVDVDAFMMDGKDKTSEVKKSFSITCGD